MKLKRIPEDFQVEELTAAVADGGRFAWYRLTKQSLGTPEAIDTLSRKWQIPRQRISYGGLKDKHAVTRQYVTILNGPRRSLQQKNLQVEYLGQMSRAFTPHDIAGNRFSIVLRDLSVAGISRASAALEEVRQTGIPNYFDDQRFGSVGQSREFIAQPWCAGNFERALWLAMADPHEDDRAGDREQKRLLREHWGDWPACKAALERSNRRSIITYLADKPGDFRGAFARMRVDLRSLYLSAFQSHLWNHLLATFLRRNCQPGQLLDVPLKMGPLPFFRSLADEQAQMLQQSELPLPSARLHLEESPLLDLMTDVLQEFGLELRQLRVKYPRDSFFSKGSRAAGITVRSPEFRVDDDDLYPKRKKLSLSFELPRGSYATILVKRLTDGAANSDATN